jgi:hypothetical protein
VKTAIFEPNFFNSTNCPIGLRTTPNGSYCQLLGPYILTLPDYNTVPVYPNMNNKCPAQVCSRILIRSSHSSLRNPAVARLFPLPRLEPGLLLSRTCVRGVCALVHLYTLTTRSHSAPHL